MIINKVYISSFGKLQNFTYEFNDGMNTILAQNGFGKTTLASFIKVMLYGFGNKSVRDDVKNERKRFMPWGGGVYGGFIEFCADGKHYKLEKFFGKTEKDDVVNLYDLATNKKMDLAGEVGEKFFGIDADAFCKSIYFPENDINSFDNESLKAKLSNCIESADDCVDYEKAVKVLENEQKLLASKKGGSGKINELNSALRCVNDEIEACQKSCELVKNYESKLQLLVKDVERLEAEKRKLDAFVQSNQRQLEFIEKQKHLKSLENDIASFNQKLNEYKAFFAKYLPTQEEMAEMENLGKEVALIEEKMNAMMPNDSDFLFYKSKSDKYGNLSAKNVENALNIAINQKSKSGKFNVKSLIFLTIALLSVVVGVVCLNLDGLGKVLKFIPFVCFGIAGVFGVLFVLKLRKKGAESGDVPNEIKSLLPFIELNANNLVNELIALKGEVDKWNKINSYLQNAGAELEQLKISYEKKSNELNYFLSNYPIMENSLVALSNIKANFNAYNYLLEQIGLKEKSVEEFNMSGNFSVMQNLGAVDSRQSADVQVQINRISESLEDSKNNVLQISHKLEQERERASNLSEFERRRNSIKMQLENASLDYRMLSLAIELMQKAKENLNSRYLGPMQNNLNAILSRLDTLLAQNGCIDTDLGLMVNCGGQLKSSEYFSQGYRAILNFCVRLALVKTIYSRECPLLILDDPFVNLDNVNLNKVNLLLSELSKTYQIVYFVCRNEFAINA